ncbi:MAG: hypothetical protein II502_00500 [Paludibacteraceae bacterium]|nr:hypothetical protein [Paludibacteraceae bacterium]
MLRCIVFLVSCFCVAFLHAIPTDTTRSPLDTMRLYDGMLEGAKVVVIEDIRNSDSLDIEPDTSLYKDLTPREIARLKWKPDPMRAVWMGAIIPGYGQIYNKSYWKLPIVYGGFMGCIYAINMNGSMYKEYRQAYRDIYIDIQNGTVSDDESKSYVALLPKGYDIARMGGAVTYQNRLQSWQNRTRRFRDLSVLGTVVVYILSIIDAYVDAQLFDFDISYDLSMQLYPQQRYDIPSQKKINEITLAIKF